MKIGIAVFAYNRDIHLNKTLEGLRLNKEVEEIYVFHDGLKCEQHREGWERTRNVIEKIDWCRTKKFYSTENKGLACSIVEGINRVMEENDAVVVLEDDCVPTANFMAFMTQCFYRYKDNKKVYNINGCGWSMDIEKDSYDAYFIGRNSTWGWGTWKDRWQEYQIDNDILERINNDRDKSRNMALWGAKDLEATFVNRLKGINNSWAIYWALHIVEVGGMCIAPYYSMIDNIGFDGSGVHCGKSNGYPVRMDTGTKRIFKLPNECMIADRAKMAFAELHGSYIAASGSEQYPKQKVLIYGVGRFLRMKEKELVEKFSIVAFVDKNKTGYYAGKRIIKVNDVKDYQYDKIVIMIMDEQESKNIAEVLSIECGIEPQKIVYGVEKFLKE